MAPFIRIGLRWLGGYLAAIGWLAEGDSGIFDDPDLVAVISYSGAAACAFVAEGWYYVARKFGWAK